MQIDLAGLPEETCHHLMMQMVIPRPIAWVLSDNGGDKPDRARWNLAPFSMFNAVCSAPPMVFFSIGHKGTKEGTFKDTWVNIERREHFVIHVVDMSMAQRMVESSAPLPHGESEVTLLDLALADFDGWPVPRLRAAKMALACSRQLMLAVGTRPNMLVFGQVHRLWLDDRILAPNPERPGRVIIDPTLVDPLARLGGDRYAGLGALLTLKRST